MHFFFPFFSCQVLIGYFPSPDAICFSLLAFLWTFWFYKLKNITSHITTVEFRDELVILKVRTWFGCYCLKYKIGVASELSWCGFCKSFSHLRFGSRWRWNSLHSGPINKFIGTKHFVPFVRGLKAGLFLLLKHLKSIQVFERALRQSSP